MMHPDFDAANYLDEIEEAIEAMRRDEEEQAWEQYVREMDAEMYLEADSEEWKALVEESRIAEAQRDEMYQFLIEDAQDVRNQENREEF